jgi:N-dimethylarginine dimethylaminohydrolase
VDELHRRGFRTLAVPDEDEAQAWLPMNGVAIAPGEILMPAGGSRMQALYEASGVTCHPVEIGELIKAGGGIHCMTGLLRRDPLLAA